MIFLVFCSLASSTKLYTIHLDAVPQRRAALEETEGPGRRMSGRSHDGDP